MGLRYFLFSEYIKFHVLLMQGEVEEETEREGAADQGVHPADDDRDPETYDDNEFYQTLLKEFFEGKQESGVNWYSVSLTIYALLRPASSHFEIRGRRFSRIPGPIMQIPVIF